MSDVCQLYAEVIYIWALGVHIILNPSQLKKKLGIVLIASSFFILSFDSFLLPLDPDSKRLPAFHLPYFVGVRIQFLLLVRPPPPPPPPPSSLAV
jgi:hypothetical protein